MMFAMGKEKTGRAISMAALPLVVLVMLAGCEKKPGGQVVAVVNSEEITQQELRAEADASNVPAGADFQKAAPAILDRVIQRNLLADYAREQGLDRGPDFVARRRQLEQALLATLAIRKLQGPQSAPKPAEVQQFISENPTLFADRQKLTLDQVSFPAPSDPNQVKALTALGTLAAVEEKLKADNVPMKRGSSVLDTASIDPSVGRQMTALPNGKLFDLSTGGVTFISAIVERASAATPPESWAGPATEALSRQRSGKTVNDALLKLRKAAKIEYDPAYKPAAVK
jgi:peptidyl-prolyl cis-trans isomerase C